MCLFRNISRFVDIDLHDSFTRFAGVHLDGPILPICVHLQHTLSTLFFPYLQGGATRCRDDDHGLIGIVFIHGLADIDTILMGDVVILAELFAIEVLLLNLGIDASDIEIDPFLFTVQLLQFLTHVHDLSLDLRVFVTADPFYRVFLLFLHIINALEDVGDVVDASFLYAQQVYGLV